METKESTLDSLKAGDVAYVRKGNTLSDSLQRVTVKRVTDAQIITDDGRRFRREDGRGTERLDRWNSRDVLYPATAKLAAQYERQENLAAVKRVQWESLDDETLAKVAALLPKKSPEM